MELTKTKSFFQYVSSILKISFNFLLYSSLIGIVIYFYWEWFFLSLKFPELSIIHAISIGLLYNLFKETSINNLSVEEKFGILIDSIIILTLGKLLHLFVI